MTNQADFTRTAAAMVAENDETRRICRPVVVSLSERATHLGGTMRKAISTLILSLMVVFAGAPLAGAADTAAPTPPQCLYDALPFPVPPAYPCTPPPGDENCAPYIDRWGTSLNAAKAFIASNQQRNDAELADWARAYDDLHAHTHQLAKANHRKARTIRHLRAEIRRLKAAAQG
jgi:hypothetical protein